MRTLNVSGAMAAMMLFGAIGHSHAASILHFDDYTGGGNQIGQALSALGETATVTDHTNFAADLSSQSWDLVIVDISGSGISPAGSSALVSYIGGGGKALMSYWNLDTDAPLATAFDVGVASSFSSLQSVYDWDAGHQVFNNPNSISFPVAFGPEQLGDNGDEFNVLGSGVAIAGFTAAPTAGRAAIVVGNFGRTIINGWSFDELSGQNGINLAANEINALLVPEPSAFVLAAVSLTGLAVWGWRRKR